MKRYRAIWISDVHLGTTECKAEYLLDFLKNNTAETIYLVGDIVDGWALKKRWYWPQKHNDVIQKLLRKARKGSKVIYIPGNHDELGRQFINMTFGDIEIKNDLIHTTLHGERLWVTHGDLFDNIISCAKWLSFVGDSLYYVILRINHFSNTLRHKYGFHYWSFSSYIKNSIKNVVKYVENFEELMAREAKRKKCDGVICGHIHKAAIKKIEGIDYYNDGDWVESLTALVETKKGKLKLVDWHKHSLS